MKNLKFLLVEDGIDFAEVISKLISVELNAEVVLSCRINDAREKIKTLAKELSAIILDACLESSKPDSMSLITEARDAGFSGPIIAFSSYDYYNDLLIKNGATHKVGNGKMSILRLLKDIYQK